MEYQKKGYNKSYMQWLKMYRLATIYYNHYKNLDIKKEFKTLDGINYCEDGEKLGVWCSTQRYEYHHNNMSVERIAMLESIGFDFREKRIFFNVKDCYTLSLAYYKKYGNLNVSTTFKTLNGTTKNKKGILLHDWLLKLNHLYQDGKLEKEYIEKFEAISFVFKDKVDPEEKWNTMYVKAKEYYNKNNCLPSYNTKEKDAELSFWLYEQRVAKRKGKLPQDKEDKLNLIHIDWNIFSKKDQWEFMFDLAKKYCNAKQVKSIKVTTIITENLEEYHNVEEVPNNVKTYNIGTWFNNVRSAHSKGKLSKQRVKRIESAGMIIEKGIKQKVAAEKWYYAFKVAKNYYNKYGNLLIPFYKKINEQLEEVTPEEQGVVLGKWLSEQRVAYRNNSLSEEQINLLESIRFEVGLEEYNHKNVRFCTDYKLNYNAYPFLVTTLPINHLKACTFYLLDHNIPIENNGQLHPIYFYDLNKIEEVANKEYTEILSKKRKKRIEKSDN